MQEAKKNGNVEFSKRVKNLKNPECEEINPFD